MAKSKLFHHSVNVSSNHVETLKEAHDKAKELFPHLITDIVYSHYNHITSFFIAPDGGKENKQISNESDELRKKLFVYLESMKSDGKDIHYVSVGYYDSIKEIEQ